MGRTLRALLLAALLTGMAAPAFAAGWPWPLGSSASLRFGEKWTDANGTACTHRGIDVVGEAGATVEACAPGTVAFCGAVPSASGGRVLALTVQTADGLKVTYMPLEGSSLSAGDGVEAGDAIGTLAAWGDGSSPGTHLHLSVKRGDLALDPEPMLAPTGDPAVAMPPPGPPAPSSAAPSGGAARAIVSAVPPAAAPVPVAAAPPVVTAPALPALDSRAIHAPKAAPLRLPALSFRAPALAAPALSLATRLALALASSLALWALFGRGGRLQAALASTRER